MLPTSALRPSCGHAPAPLQACDSLASTPSAGAPFARVLGGSFLAGSSILACWLRGFGTETPLGFQESDEVGGGGNVTLTWQIQRVIDTGPDAPGVDVAAPGQALYPLPAVPTTPAEDGGPDVVTPAARWAVAAAVPLDSAATPGLYSLRVTATNVVGLSSTSTCPQQFVIGACPVCWGCVCTVPRVVHCSACPRV